MQKLEAKSVTLAIPSKWQPKYILKRIGDEDITIALDTRNNIIEQLARGGKYVQIGEYTIMLNAIKSIDPMWPPKNIPPKPRFNFEFKENNGTVTKFATNREEREEWEKYFENL